MIGPQLAPATGLEQRCVRQFPRIALARGRQYFRAGHVSDASQMGEAFSLTVKGQGETYAVWIDFSQAGAAGSLEVRCSCPFYTTGGLCKHLWASVIKLERSGLSEKVPGAGPLRVLHERNRPGTPAMPRVAPLNSPAPIVLPRPQSTTQWLERLEKIQGKGGAKHAGGFASNLVASFVINAAESVAAGKLILDLWTRTRAMNGDPGPLRPSRLPNRDVTLFSDPLDQEMVALLSRTGSAPTAGNYDRAGANPASRFVVDTILESQVIASLSGAGKLFLSRSPNGSPDDADRPLRMDRGKPWELELKVEAVGSVGYRLEGVLKRDSEFRNLNEPVLVLRSGFLIFGERVGRLTEPRHASWIVDLRSGQEFVVPHEQGDILLRRILTDPTAPRLSWPEGMGWSKTLIQPRPKGIFRPLGNDPSTGRMSLTVNFDYAGREVPLSEQAESLIDVEQKQVYTRNLAFEEGTLTQALEILRDPQGTGTIPVSELHRAATELSSHGWIVFIENQRVIVADDFAMSVSTSTDWFEVKLEAKFGDNSLKQSEILAALAAKSGLVKLPDGSLGMLPKEWLARYATLQTFGEKNADGSLRFSKSQGLMLNAALGEEDHVRGDRGFTTFRKKVGTFEGVKLAKAPVGFKGKLRNYQKEGLSWLGFLEEFEVGGILADDMGLGKTIQLLAFLQARKKTSKLPSLVIAPKSLVFNWIDEAKKFVPGLKVVRYSGEGRTKFAKEIGNADLVVTTYGTLRTDIEQLREQEFDVAVVDEAQFIKNPKSQAAIACKQVRAKMRLALTGTPIENSIRDLLSILEFTSPDLLSLSPEAGLADDTKGALARMLRPFLLRRTKEAVLTELPAKSEQVLFCEMSDEEREIYTTIRDRYRESLNKEIAKNGLGKSKIHVLEALLRLRQAACHPGLIDPKRKGDPGAKLELLLTQLRAVIDEGHKALVFSQFTSLLDIVRTNLDTAGITYEYLDGKTEDRKTPVERFQSDPNCPVFLISLKAGGTGLNLTAADYVFILDPWWNPAVEAQAIGRAHRMGQTQKVFAYRMIARGTVEEKIVELQQTKKDLAESILSEDKDFMKKLSKEDLEQLLM